MHVPATFALQAKELGVRSVVIDGPESWSQTLEKDGIIEKFIGIDFSDADTVFDQCLAAIKKAQSVRLLSLYRTLSLVTLGNIKPVQHKFRIAQLQRGKFDGTLQAAARVCKWYAEVKHCIPETFDCDTHRLNGRTCKRYP